MHQISLNKDIRLLNITNWQHFCHCQNQNYTALHCRSPYGLAQFKANHNKQNGRNVCEKDKFDMEFKSLLNVI
jgi:hypothetical protein